MFQGISQGGAVANGQVKIIGNYQYNPRHCLGEGAYGKVYEGEDKISSRKVAIKKLDIRQFQNDTYLRNSIISEIEILKRFNHRNIVKFIDQITTQRSLYIITEFCKDGDLRALMQTKKLSEDQALIVLYNIVEGFRELVKHNVTHRDLKPANILRHEGVFKIADFGFAKYVDYSSAQMLRSCVGSPLYMAPQILARQPYGLKSDLWSIGVIFHEMLYHEVPWKARDERELLDNINRHPYILRKTLKLQPISEEILRRTLIKDENERISWEDLFKLLDKSDLGNAMRPNPFLSNKENSVPASILQQQQPFRDVANKMKKSIFEANTNNQQQQQTAAIQLRRQTSLQQPTQQAVLSLPTSPANNFSRQTDTRKMFNVMNQKRIASSFKQFVCVDLLSKVKKNQQFMNNLNLSYEKFLLYLTVSAKVEMQLLIFELSDLESSNKDLFSMKELKSLSATIKRENEYLKMFASEFLGYIKSANILEQFKCDKDAQFLIVAPCSLVERLNDSERNRLEDYIQSAGNGIAKEMLNELKRLIGAKQQIDQEMYRPQIISAEYILDLIEAKKKLSKGAEVFFDQLHTSKSEHNSVSVHLDKALNKLPKFFNLM